MQLTSSSERHDACWTVLVILCAGVVAHALPPDSPQATMRVHVSSNSSENGYREIAFPRVRHIKIAPNSFVIFHGLLTTDEPPVRTLKPYWTLNGETTALKKPYFCHGGYVTFQGKQHLRLYMLNSYFNISGRYEFHAGPFAAAIDVVIEEGGNATAFPDDPRVREKYHLNCQKRPVASNVTSPTTAPLPEATMRVHVSSNSSQAGYREIPFPQERNITIPPNSYVIFHGSLTTDQPKLDTLSPYWTLNGETTALKKPYFCQGGYITFLGKQHLRLYMLNSYFNISGRYEFHAGPFTAAIDILVEEGGNATAFPDDPMLRKQYHLRCHHSSVASSVTLPTTAPPSKATMHVYVSSNSSQPGYRKIPFPQEHSLTIPPNSFVVLDGLLTTDEPPLRTLKPYWTLNGETTALKQPYFCHGGYVTFHGKQYLRMYMLNSYFNISGRYEFHAGSFNAAINIVIEAGGNATAFPDDPLVRLYYNLNCEDRPVAPATTSPPTVPTFTFPTDTPPAVTGTDSKKQLMSALDSYCKHLFSAGGELHVAAAAFSPTKLSAKRRCLLAQSLLWKKAPKHFKL